MRIILSFLLCLVLSSCGRARFEEKLQERLHLTEQQLIQREGMPSNVYTDEDGTKYLTYNIDRGSTGRVSSVNTYNPYGNFSNSYGSYSSTNLSCNITYIIDGNSKMVTNTTYNGNDCYRLITTAI